MWTTKKLKIGAGAKAQWLKAHGKLPEDQSSRLSTPVITTAAEDEWALTHKYTDTCK